MMLLTVLKWTFSSREALLHLRSDFFFFFVCIWWQSCWHDLIEKVVPKCSRNTALLFISSSVTHCASCRLRWSYCEFINCPPRPWHVPQDNYEAASHGFILYSPISCMKTKLSCPMWLVTLRKKSFFHFIFLGSISLLYLLSFFCTKTKKRSCGFSVVQFESVRGSLMHPEVILWMLYDRVSQKNLILMPVHWNNLLVNQYFFLPNHCILPNVVFYCICLIVSKWK